MSLFGSIQLGANTLRAMQIGLQVTGNNIANANTPGFVRQEVIYSPAPVQKIGNLVLGLGVQVDAIVDKAMGFSQSFPKLSYEEGLKLMGPVRNPNENRPV